MKRRGYETVRTKIRKKRPKTFKTEEAANVWAKEKGLKGYKLFNMRNSLSKKKKIRVIEAA